MSQPPYLPPPGSGVPPYQQPVYGQPASPYPPQQGYDPTYAQQYPPYAQPPSPYGPPQPPYGQPPPLYGQPPQPYGPPGGIPQQQYGAPASGTYAPQQQLQQQPVPNNQRPNKSGGIDPDVPPTEFSYDPYNISYHNISVNQFNAIPNEKTDYSMYWDNPQAFEPETFEENTKKETKWNDLAFLIAFWIHFAITIGIFVWVIITEKDSPSTSTGSTTDDIYAEFDTEGTSLLWKTIGTGVAVGIVINIIHFVYMTFAPLAYIKLGFFIGVAVAIVMCIVPAVLFKTWAVLVYPVIWLIISVCIYCCCKKRIPFSAAVLKQTCHLICRYPSILFLELLSVIIDVGVSVFFCAFIYYIQFKRLSNYIYIYIIFSYFWTSLTFGFVMYITASGLASTWYFLNDTDFFPKNPCLQSLKRATTTSFGSAALAGLLLAIIQTLKAIIYMDIGGQSGIVGMVICLLKCIALCILNILECCLSFITRYALIYCATFGVPFKEGCRRFVELQCNRFIDALMSGCIINLATTFNMLTFSVGAAVLGYGLGFLVFAKDSFFGPIFTCVFCLVFTLCIFLIVMEPVGTMTDTIFICFAEAPERLKTSANELYEMFVDIYGKGVSEKTEKTKGKKGGKRKRRDSSS